MKYKQLAIIDFIWGDNGKGIISYTDAIPYDVVIRFQGGSNAGHTIYANNRKYVLHIIPCGALYPDKICIIAGGCVINLDSLINEINALENLDIYLKGRLHIYNTATLVTDFEIALDIAKENESENSGKKIGTTKNGIGYAYANRAFRNALIIQDLCNTKVLKEKIYDLAKSINPILISLGAKEVDPETVFNKMKSQAEEVRQYIIPNTYVSELQKQGKTILFEGAQGLLLDPLNGTYPYVTSFPIHPGIIGPSCGISTKDIYVIGVMKAYTTRVGGGPFPTEIGGEIEELLRTIGKEFGATTGRPRRCGWTDIPLIKYAITISGIDEITMTCFDTLYKMGRIKICTHYIVDGERFETAPSVIPDILSKVETIYEDFEFDDTDITGINNWDDLPKLAQKFIKKIQSCLDIPITRVKTGPNIEDILDVPQI
ncbi:MAG: adenylosuccinate synthase [Patescibacteria group bacterium]|nr:adenylosuccinate synthase [Patescibacteria group bacterium]MDD4304664.1 adenylosuccinate synthase [Patescibacteria group bacterium]MDD4695695.1 adenylosuccinate synthase [Patescibacteria group bacterium]